MTKPATPVLMSSDNPEGWKLEDLLDQIRSELVWKCDKIRHDRRPEAQLVLCHNRQIMALLSNAEALQRHSLAVLEHVGPNQGPRGKPRIGEGS